MLFARKKKQAAYDWTGKVPVVRSSICTGEQVAGFKDPESGKFTEMLLIRNDRDLQAFLRQYQVEEADLKWEW